MRTVSLALRSLACIAALCATRAAISGELPSGVVVRVDQRDVSDDEFAEFVGTETLHEAAATELLELMEQDRVIELEAARRQISASESDVDDAWRRLDAEARRQQNGPGLAEALAQRGVSEDEFRHELHRLVLLDRMARQDFGIDAEDPVPPEKQNLWLQDRMAHARIAAVDEPGIVARVEDTPITAADLGRRYLKDLARRGHRDRQLLDQLVGIVAIESDAAKKGVTLGDADLARAIAESERRLREKPGFEDAALDDVLKKTGRSVDRLKSSRRFRAMLLLERLADRRWPRAELKKYRDEHAAELDGKIGASLELRTIFLRAGTEGARTTGFVKRGYPDAEAELAALRQRIEKGEIEFATAAKTRSEHATAPSGGALGAVRAATPGLEALFAAANGAQDGALVGPVRTVDGVHLLQVVAHRPAPPFEQVEGAVRADARDAYLRELTSQAVVTRRE